MRKFIFNGWFLWMMVLPCTMLVFRGQAQPGRSGAQTGSAGVRITGTILDVGQQPIVGATVALIRDSSRIGLAVTDSRGFFEIPGMPVGNYHVVVTAIGYLEYKSEWLTIGHDEPAIGLGTISMRRKADELDQVTVMGKRPLMEQKIDRLIINVDAAVTNTGSTALEILQKSPGVSVDKDGNISLRGRQGVTVMIDGKPAYLAGADLANLLSSMNANQLDQIEIMTNPPAKYDAAGNAGIINIRTKKNRSKGFNGSLSAGYGQGRYWKTNNSLNLNYRNGSYNLFANMSYNANRGYTDLHLIRSYLDGDGKTVNSIFDEPTYLNRKFASSNLKLGMDYFLSAKTTLGIVGTGFISPRNFDGNSTGFLQDANAHTDSVTHTLSTNDSRVVNGTVNLNLRQLFDSAHELTADADFIQYRSTDPQTYLTQSSYPDGTITGTDLLKGDLPATIRIYSGKTDYSQSLGKGMKLEGGWKSSWVLTDNAANYYNLDAGVWEPDYGKTNAFNYRENINAGYVNFSGGFGGAGAAGGGEGGAERWSYQVGLRYEHTDTHGFQAGNPQRPDSSFAHHYDGWFPTIFLSFQADKNNQFALTGGRRIDRPNYQDLNPFLFFIGQYTYQEGNPFLNPQYTNNLELSHIFKGVLTTALSYSHTDAYITQLFRTQGDTTIFTNGNLGELQTVGLSVNAQLSPVSWWSVTLHGEVDYKTVHGRFADADIVTKAFTEQYSVNNQFRWKKGWSGEVSGVYNSRDVEGQFIVMPYGQVSAGLSKQLFHNKATIKFNVQDIFFTQRQDGRITYANVREHFVQSGDSRVGNISFSYRFGKSAKDAARVKHGGADEEQSRVKL
jgi:iron complex outermembrane recepter protein